ncbi:MAG: hypothetical protein LBK76_05140 [Verrucomicrobiales bacterium]|jgi:hypothetical protein|nr:hypothetical protein [Verrucomicrobiales bacterium]
MSQLSLYLDDHTILSVQKGAKAARTSLSKYVARILTEHFAGNGNWSDDFLATLGSITDETFTTPEEPATTADARRERL